MYTQLTIRNRHSGCGQLKTVALTFCKYAITTLKYQCHGNTDWAAYVMHCIVLRKPFTSHKRSVINHAHTCMYWHYVDRMTFMESLVTVDIMYGDTRGTISLGGLLALIPCLVIWYLGYLITGDLVLWEGRGGDKSWRYHITVTIHFRWASLSGGRNRVP